MRLALAKFESCSVVFVCSLRSVQGDLHSAPDGEDSGWKRQRQLCSVVAPGKHGPTFLSCFETPR